MEKGLGIDHKEGLRFFGIREGPDHTGITPAQQLGNTDHNYLLGEKSVNELTAEFVRVLRDQVTSKLKGEGGKGKEKEDGLYAWLQDMMFNASTTAFMGSRMLEVYPNLRENFFNFDRVMLTMFFGIPKWLSPKTYNVREKVLGELIEWQQQMQERVQKQPCRS